MLAREEVRTLGLEAKDRFGLTWPAIAKATSVPLATAAEEVLGGVSDVAGGGGGFSAVEPTPSYQQGVSGTNRFHAVQYLTPTDYQTIAPGLVEPTEWTSTPPPA